MEHLRHWSQTNEENREKIPTYKDKNNKQNQNNSAKSKAPGKQSKNNSKASENAAKKEQKEKEEKMAAAVGGVYDFLMEH